MYWVVVRHLLGFGLAGKQLGRDRTVETLFEGVQLGGGEGGHGLAPSVDETI